MERHVPLAFARPGCGATPSPALQECKLNAVGRVSKILPDPEADLLRQTGLNGISLRGRFLRQDVREIALLLGKRRRSVRVHARCGDVLGANGAAAFPRDSGAGAVLADAEKAAEFARRYLSSGHYKHSIYNRRLRYRLSRVASAFGVRCDRLPTFPRSNAPIACCASATSCECPPLSGLTRCHSESALPSPHRVPALIVATIGFDPRPSDSRFFVLASFASPCSAESHSSPLRARSGLPLPRLVSNHRIKRDVCPC